MIEKIKKISAITLICLIVISFVFCNLATVQAVGNDKEYAEYMSAKTDYLVKKSLWEKEEAKNPVSAATFTAAIVMGEAEDNMNEKYNISVDALNTYNAKVAAEAAVKAESDAKTAAKTQSANWWGQANSFFTKQTDAETIGTDPLLPLVDILKILGNAVIIISTIFLGIKYMFGSVEGKVEVKEGLMTLVVAMVFFYGYTSLEAIFVNRNNLTLNVIGDSPETTINNIYSIILYIANFAAIGTIIYVGVKYLMAGAEGKAELKAKGLPFVIGLIMTFATISFLNIILKVMGEVIK